MTTLLHSNGSIKAICIFWMYSMTITGGPHFIITSSVTVPTCNSAEWLALPQSWNHDPDSWQPTQTSNCCSIPRSCEPALKSFLAGLPWAKSMGKLQEVGGCTHISSSFKNPCSPHLMMVIMTSGTAITVMWCCTLWLHRLVTEIQIPITACAMKPWSTSPPHLMSIYQNMHKMANRSFKQNTHSYNLCLNLWPCLVIVQLWVVFCFCQGQEMKMSPLWLHKDSLRKLEGYWIKSLNQIDYSVWSGKAVGIFSNWFETELIFLLKKIKISSNHWTTSLNWTESMVWILFKSELYSRWSMHVCMHGKREIGVGVEVEVEVSQG